MASEEDSMHPANGRFPVPPSVDLDSPYAACYCEENAYLLARTLCERVQAHARETALDDEHKRAKAGSTSQDTGKQDAFPWNVDVHVVVVSNQSKSVVLWQQKASLSPSEDYPVIWDYHVFVALTYSILSNSKTTVSTRSRPGSHGLEADSGDPACDHVVHTKGLSDGLPHAASGSSHLNTDDVSWSTRPSSARTWIYDLDSVLGASAPFSSYISATFKPDQISLGRIPARFRSQFRVVPARHFLSNFASDRSHMLVPASPKGNGVAGIGTGMDEEGKAKGEHEERNVYSSPPPPWDPLLGPGARARGEVHNLMRCWVNMQPQQAGGEGEGDSVGDGEGFGTVLSDMEFFKGGWASPGREQDNVS